MFRSLSFSLSVSALVGAMVGIASTASAQSLGTSTWQLQPYCNVVTVNVTGVAGVYTLEGFDDQCGAATRAPLTGVATPNPDGTIGFGMNLVTSPGGRGVQVEARISMASLAGPWTDSDGNQGTFAFNQKTGGSPRPLPAPAVPTAIQLRPDGGFVAAGAETGPIPASGPGARMMWHAGKAAFRAGQASNDAWDDANVGRYSTAFGEGTRASGHLSFASGAFSRASGVSSTAIGVEATASGIGSIAMGWETRAQGDYATAMGYGTTASGNTSTALGLGTTASGTFSTAIGNNAVASGVNSLATGSATTAAGLASTTMGTLAATTAAATGSFVYGDGSTLGAGNAVVASTLPNQFLVRAAGGTVFWSTAGTTFPTSPGVVLYAGDSAWSNLSDVDSKENFRDLAGDDVLGRIAAMPVREWNYKAQDQTIRHIGPTAQDFHAAFGLGRDERRISTVDADGVALAGVKALEARTRALDDQNRLREQLATLSARLDQLETRPH